MKRFRSWISSEKEKLKALPPSERIPYIWDYYRLQIISLLVIAGLLGWGVHHYINSPSDSWFFACFANTSYDLEEGSEFYGDYAAYAGYDLKEKPMIFNSHIYVKPRSKTAGNQYYQLLIAYMDSGSLDTLVMGREDLLKIGSSGRLMDLESEEMKDIYNRYKDRLVYCKPLEEDYGKEKVAVGIDLAGTSLTGPDGPYPDNAVLGINALAPHPDQAEKFLSFLFGNSDREV